RPPILSVAPAGAGVWHSVPQIRQRCRAAGYRYGLRRSWAVPPCDRRERGQSRTSPLSAGYYPRVKLLRDKVMGGKNCSSFLRRKYTRWRIDHAVIPVHDHRKGIEARRSLHPDIIDCTLHTYARHMGLERGYSAYAMCATFMTTVIAVCGMRTR